MHNYLATVPFDLYELHIFELVARYGTFTQAAKRGGLTQSAITRIIQRIEHRLGVRLFERDTRHVLLTPAGEILLKKGRMLTQEITVLQEQLQGASQAPRTIHVGIERTIGLAYLPGFFRHFQKTEPGITIDLLQDSTSRLFDLLQERELDLAIVPLFGKVPRTVEVAHQFEDDFIFIAPSSFGVDTDSLRRRDLKKLAKGVRWLMLSRSNPTGRALSMWLRQRGSELEPVIESENVELLINMVAMDIGVSIVPNRALPLYLQRHNIRKVPMQPRFSRSLGVLARKGTADRPYIKAFLENILF